MQRSRQPHDQTLRAQLGLRHPYIISGGQPLWQRMAWKSLNSTVSATTRCKGKARQAGRLRNTGAHNRRAYAEFSDPIWDRISTWDWVSGESDPLMQRVVISAPSLNNQLSAWISSLFRQNWIEHTLPRNKQVYTPSA